MGIFQVVGLSLSADDFYIFCVEATYTVIQSTRAVQYCVGLFEAPCAEPTAYAVTLGFCPSDDRGFVSSRVGGYGVVYVPSTIAGYAFL